MATEIYDFSVIRDLRKQNELTISDVSAKSGVSSASISKLERNQSGIELGTLSRLASVFGIKAAELLFLAEARTSQVIEAENYASNGFQFLRVSYSNMKAMIGTGSTGEVLSRPEEHRDDYEVCWVLEGKVEITVANETHEIAVGQSLQFDAVLEHTYRVIEKCKVLIVHLSKGKRF